jgi:hypothetical protein
MTIISATPGGSGDPYARLVASLQVEFENSESALWLRAFAKLRRPNSTEIRAYSNTISGGICWQILAMMRVAKSALGSRY